VRARRVGRREAFVGRRFFGRTISRILSRLGLGLWSCLRLGLGFLAKDLHLDGLALSRRAAEEQVFVGQQARDTQEGDVHAYGDQQSQKLAVGDSHVKLSVGRRKNLRFSGVRGCPCAEKIDAPRPERHILDRVSLSSTLSAATSR
jgi:hypothetical protein